MRTFTPGFNTEKNKNACTPFNKVKIEFPSPVNTQWFSSIDVATNSVEGKVIDWGSYYTSVNEESVEVSSFDFTIEDSDYALLEDVRDINVEGVLATLYQAFAGTLTSDDYALAVLKIRKVEWQEQNQLRVICESVESTALNRFGTFANRDLFPALRKDQQNVVLPRVFGRVNRSPAVQVIAANKTTLAIPLSVGAEETVVNDGRDMEQGVSKDYFIGRELVTASITGNEMTITDRGKTVASGGTVGDAPDFLSFKANLSPQGPNWIGYRVEFTLPDSSTIDRLITGYTAPNIYSVDAYISEPGTMVGQPIQVLSNNTPYDIYGPESAHSAGTEVYEALDEYVWIINDAPSSEVKWIETEASLVIQRGDIDDTLKDLHTIIHVDPSYYTINLDDNQFAGDLGHNVTTVTMPFDPKNLPNTPYSTEDIYATLVSETDLQTPIEVIEQILSESGITNLDTSTKNSVDSDSDWIELGFTLQEQRSGLELAYDIAFQCRISFHFEGEEVKFFYLENGEQTTVLTIDDEDRVEDGIQSISYEEVDKIVNVIHVNYSENGEQKRETTINQDSIDKVGEKVKDLHFWAHKRKYSAISVANFWLQRWADATEIVKFSTYLTTMQLERRDWVTLDFDNLYLNTTKGEIRAINHIPGNAVTGTMDQIEYTVRTSRFGGCNSACQLYAEQNCSSSCQVSCQDSAETSCTFACETTCQEACELICVAACELSCTTTEEAESGGGTPGGCQTQCESSCQGACEQACQTAEETGCATGCEATCQVGCTTGCEYACQTGETSSCGTGCTSTCQTGCQAGCEIMCQSGCECDCQAGCEGQCQTGCETTCECQCQTTMEPSPCTSGTETCYTSCQGFCQTGCTTGCQAGCQGYCQTGCQEGCEILCQIGCQCNCQGTCENACTISCEVSCQCDCQSTIEYSNGSCGGVGCQTGCTNSVQFNVSCQTSCRQSCTTQCTSFCETGCTSESCVTSCQGYCQTGCQEGCELYCTVGCQCDCQATCETACRSGGCEASCQCVCQTSSQS